MTIAHIQSGGTTASNTASVARAFGSNVSAGSLVVVVCSQWNDNTVTEFVAGSCTKTAGTATIDTIAIDRAAVVNGAASTQVGVWTCLVTGAGSLTLTVTGEANSYWEITTAEFSGSWDSSRLEASNEATGTSGTAPSSGNATTAGAGLFVGGLAFDSGSTITTTPDGAFTEMYENENAGATVGHSAIYRLVSSGTTDAADWTLGTAPIAWESVVAAYKEAAGGAGYTPRATLLGVG